MPQSLRRADTLVRPQNQQLKQQVHGVGGGCRQHSAQVDRLLWQELHIVWKCAVLLDTTKRGFMSKVLVQECEENILSGRSLTMSHVLSRKSTQQLVDDTEKRGNRQIDLSARMVTGRVEHHSTVLVSTTHGVDFRETILNILRASQWRIQQHGQVGSRRPRQTKTDTRSHPTSYTPSALSKLPWWRLLQRIILAPPQLTFNSPRTMARI